MTPLYERYKKEIVPELQKELGISNVFALPRLLKVKCNVGTGKDGLEDSKVLDDVNRDLALITGQKPVITKARKAVSNFKIRRGMPVGCTVTLRRKMMYNFVDKLINIVMPRIRDFRGISSRSFDKAGNYSIGLQEHIIFPEIDIEKVKYIFGMNITFVFANGEENKSYELLKRFGMPFRNGSDME
jgi:large subunit ribosomal protein L5